MGGCLVYSYAGGWSTFSLELPSADLLEPTVDDPVAVSA